MAPNIYLILALSLIIGCAPAVASDFSFVTPKRLLRHAGQDLPVFIPLAKVLTAPTTFQHRAPATSIWEPGLDAVNAAPKPLALSVQSGPGSGMASAMRAQMKIDETAFAAAARFETLHSYTDAGGQRYDTGFRRDSEYLAGSTAFKSGTRLGMSLSRDSLADTRLPHYGLDAPGLDRLAIGLSATSIPLSGYFDTLDWKAGWLSVDLYADNYSLRTPGSMKLAIESSGGAWGGAMRVSRKDGAWVTLELSREAADADRYNQEYGFGTVSAIRLPDAHANRMAVEAGNTWAWPATRMEVALRADLATADAGRADQRPTVTGPAAATFNATPRELYRRYYGGGDTSHADAQLGGRLRVSHDLADGLDGFIDLSRAARLPELSELYYGNSGAGDLIQVGNPALKAEKHHRVESGVTMKSSEYVGYGRAGRPGTFRVDFNAFANHIQDFITIDRARGQHGVTASDNGIVYRNVEAGIGGVSGDLQANLMDHVSARMTISGQRGRNFTDNRSLYQVAPLEANLFLDAFGTDIGWNLGIRQRLVAGKRSVDDSTLTGSGQDKGGPAGAFATTDIYGGYVLHNSLTLSAGVENLFDKLYREHLSAVPNSPITTILNAPGRTFFLRGMMAF